MKVGERGVYRLSHSLLAEWGFGRPEDVRIAGFGSVRCAHSLDALPEELPQISIMRTDDAIYFYADGDRLLIPGSDGEVEIHRNFYSTGSHYFIGESTGLPDMTVTETMIDDSADSERVIESHTEVTLFPTQEVMLGEGGVLFHSRSVTETPLRLSFPTAGMTDTPILSFKAANKSASRGTLQLDLEGISETSSSRILLDLDHSDEMNWDYREAPATHIPLPLAEGADSVAVTFSSASPGVFDYLGVRDVCLVARRKNIVPPTGCVVGFKDLSARSSVVFEADGAATVWDVTDPQNISACRVKNNGNVVADVHAAGRDWIELCAFTASAAIPSPEFEGEISQFTDFEGGADMLIVTTDSTFEEGVRLADAHEAYQGIKVKVVRQSELFDRFSSGAFHPAAIRAAAGRLSSEEDHPLRYLCLIGTAPRDPRRLLPSTPIAEYLAGYQAEAYEDIHICTSSNCSDSYFGLLHQGPVPPSLHQGNPKVNISVGRIPASTRAEAAQYVDKAVAYLADPALAGDYMENVILGCKGDRGFHLETCELVANDISAYRPGATVRKAYPQLYPVPTGLDAPVAGLKNFFRESMAGRPRFYAYTGHAWYNTLAYNNHTLVDEKQMTYGSMPMAYLATCRGLPIDFDGMSMGHAALMKSTGPIALVTSSREISLNHSAFLLQLFTRAYLTSGHTATWGDVWLRALNAALGSTPAIRSSVLLLNFAGDPALPARIPELRVELTERPDTLPALSTATLKGRITGSDGKVCTDFNGRVTLRIFDGAAGRTTICHDATEKSLPVTTDHALIGAFATEVVAGEWELTITTPEVTRIAPSRVTFDAFSPSSGQFAAGSAEIFIELPAEPATLSDEEAPQIEILIDGHVPDPEIIRQAPRITVNITDSGTGPAFNPSIVGGTPDLRIDGLPVGTAVASWQPVEGGGLTLNFTPTSLTDGEHRVEVTVRDFAGNRSAASETFTIVRALPALLLQTDASIARDRIEFSLSGPTPIPSEGRLIIRDLAGNTRFSAPVDSFPFEWDFVGNGTDEYVPDGFYRASYIYTDGLRHGSTPEVKFTIIRRK